MPDNISEAYVTLATNDMYSLGCLVLAHSLRRSATTRHLVVMVTDGVSSAMLNQLHTTFDLVFKVDLLDSHDPSNLQLLGRPDLNVTFTKLHCWKLTQYSKAVFLDADTMVLRNVDDLFDREELSAAPDAGWPDCFNSGVFVFKPNMETYESLLQFALENGSFDGGDQGLLNSYFSDWSTKDISKHLPFVYNVVSQAFYSYLPAFTRFRDRVRIVHFIGAVKPWHHAYDRATGEVVLHPHTVHNVDFLKMWWTILFCDVKPVLNHDLEAMIGSMIEPHHLGGGDHVAGVYDERTESERKLAWERGDIDYLGHDCFENIKRKLDVTLEKGSSETIVTASKAPFPSVPSVAPPKVAPMKSAVGGPDDRSVSLRDVHIRDKPLNTASDHIAACASNASTDKAELDKKPDLRLMSGKSDLHLSGKPDHHHTSGKSDLHLTSGKPDLHLMSGKSDLHLSGKPDHHHTSGKSDLHPTSGKSDLHFMSGKTDLHHTSGKSDLHLTSGKPDLHLMSGKADLHNTSGKSDLHHTSGKSDLHPTSGKSDLHFMSGKTDLHHTSGKSDLHLTSGKPDLHLMSGKADLHNTSGKSDLHHTSGKSDLHPTSGKSDLHFMSGKTDLHHTSGKSDLHLTSGKSDLHLTSGKPDLHLMSGKADLHNTSGKSDLHLVSRKPDLHHTTGKPDLHHMRGKSDLHQITGKPDLHHTSGKSDFHLASGKPDLHHTSGKSDLHLASGKSDLHLAGGKSDLNVTSGKPDLHLTSGKPDLHHTSGKPDLHHTRGKSDLHHTSGKSDLHRTSGKPDLHHTSAKPEVHHTSAKPDVHHTSGKSDLHLMSGKSDLHLTSGKPFQATSGKRDIEDPAVFVVNKPNDPVPSASRAPDHKPFVDFKHPDVQPKKKTPSRGSENDADKKSPVTSPIAHPDFVTSPFDRGESPVSRIRMGIAAADSWKPENRIKLAQPKNTSALSLPGKSDSDPHKGEGHAARGVQSTAEPSAGRGRWVSGGATGGWKFVPSSAK